MGVRLAQLGSLVLHAIALGALAGIPRTRPRAAPVPAPIALRIVERVPPATPTPTASRTHDRYSALRPRHVAAMQHPLAPAQIPEPRGPASRGPQDPSPGGPPVPSTGGPARPVDLFPGALLSTVAGDGSAAIRGRTRRAGDGLPVPGEHDAASDREEAAGRVHGWLREAAGEADVTSGRVDAAWRDAERGVVQRYHPTAPQISSENPTWTFIQQWQRAHPSSGASTDGAMRARDPSVGTPEARSQEQFAAAQQALYTPAEWCRTDVDAEVDADGTIRSLRIAAPSGRRRLDELALEAVRGTLARRPVRDPRGAVRARFAVEAAVVASPPPAITPILGGGGAVVGAGVDLLGLATRVVRAARKEDQREVRTRVHLLWVFP